MNNGETLPATPFSIMRQPITGSGMTSGTLSRETAALLAEFGVAGDILSAGDLPVFSPIDGSRIAALQRHDPADLERMIGAAERAFVIWHSVPPPRRGELVRLYAEELRHH